MTVENLLELLHDMPLDALKKPMFVDIVETGAVFSISVDPVTKSCEDDEVMGYIIVVNRAKEPVQMELPFNVENN